MLVTKLFNNAVDHLIGNFDLLRFKMYPVVITQLDYRSQWHHCFENHRVSLHNLYLWSGDCLYLLLFQGLFISLGNQLIENIVQ